MFYQKNINGSVYLIVGLVIVKSLLGQQNGLDVGKNSAISNCDVLKETVQLLVIANSKLDVTRANATFLVVA